MTETMIERVARAVIAAINDGPGFADETARLDNVTVDARVDMLAVTRAAIAAMREPTPQQCAAALAALDDGTVADPKAAAWDATRAYRAMIDAALKEAPDA